MAVLGGGAVSYERGTPVEGLPLSLSDIAPGLRGAGANTASGMHAVVTWALRVHTGLKGMHPRSATQSLGPFGALSAQARR